MEGHQAVLRRLRRYRWLLLGLLVVFVVGAVVLQRRSGVDPQAAREHSKVVDGTVEAPSRALDAYAIRYSIETYTDAGKTTTTDAILVERPFNARVRSTGSTGTTETFGAFGRYSVRGTAFYVPPGGAEPDRRADTVIADAVDDGYAERREVREITLGERTRRCRVYRFGDGSEATSLSTLELADTYTDICIDASGLILEEATFDGRKLVRRRIALEVDESPTVDDDLFDLEVPDGDARQIGSLQTLEDDSRLPGDEFWELPDGLDGFTFKGRYAVIPPGQPGFTDITSHGSVITFLSEVWTNGPDVVVIDQGATRGTKPWESDANGKAIKAGAIGKGELLYSLRESEARFLLGGVRFLRIRGSVPPSELVDIAGQLEAVPGGPLRVAEDQRD